MADGIDRAADSKLPSRSVSRFLELTLPSTDRMEFSTSKEVTVAPTFDDMHLKENLLRGIYAYGYESPSAVQSRAIVQICKGRDTIAQAQSGTGKTATFSISILQVIDTVLRETQGKHRFRQSRRSVELLIDTARSSRPLPYARVGDSDPIRHHGARRLHERAVPRLHRWYERRRRYSEAGAWPACGVRNSRSRR